MCIYIYIYMYIYVVRKVEAERPRLGARRAPAAMAPKPREECLIAIIGSND